MSDAYYFKMYYCHKLPSRLQLCVGVKLTTLEYEAMAQTSEILYGKPRAKAKAWAWVHETYQDGQVQWTFQGPVSEYDQQHWIGPTHIMLMVRNAPKEVSQIWRILNEWRSIPIT